MPTLPTTAARTAARTAHDRRLGVVAELDLDRCSNLYGVSPCTAGRAHSDTAQAGASTTLTLAAGASAVDDAYAGMTAHLHAGAGSAQEQRIASYVGATKVATLVARWRTNRLLYSEDHSNAAWTKTNCTIVASAVAAPADSGCATVQEILEDNTAPGSQHRPSQTATFAATANNTYLYSVWTRRGSGTRNLRLILNDSVAAATAEAPFDLAAGTAGSTATSGVGWDTVTSGIEAWPDDWYRCWIRARKTTANANVGVIPRLTEPPDTSFYDGDGTSSLLLSGEQLEQNVAALGDYIATAAAAILNPDNTSQYHVIDRSHACYNTYPTCQDTAHYVLGTHTYRLCSRGMGLPPGELVRPYVSAIDGAVTVIDPEAGLARRATLSLACVDESDSDREQDPYVDDRASPAQGTFWGRLFARNPNLAGRFARVRRGYVVAPWDWDTFLDELYIIDRADGPDRDGVSLTLKDPLKLVDRTQIPAPTDGKLVAELKDYAWRGLVVSATATTVVLGSDAPAVDDAVNGMEAYVVASTGSGQRRTISDYVGSTRTATLASAWDVIPGTSSTLEVSALSVALTTGKGAQYPDPATSGKREFVRIGAELIEVHARSGDTLSWTSSAARAQFGSARATASAGAQVQLCRAFIDAPVTDVCQALLEEGGLDPAYIDTASFTAAEAEWYGPQYHVTCCLSEPEPPSDQLAELLPQIGAVIWWSPQTQRAALVTITPRLTTPAAWTDAAQLIDGSVAVERLEDLRLTYAAIYYGQLDATSNRREPKHFGRGEIYIDEDPNLYGDRRIDVVYSRWFGPSNEVAMRTFVARRLAALRDAPRRVRARLDPKDYDLPAGELVDITTRRIVGVDGAPLATRCLITKIDDRGTHIEAEARTTGFAKRYFFIAPNSAGDYPADPQYGHISHDTGLMGNGDGGYLII